MRQYGLAIALLTLAAGAWPKAGFAAGIDWAGVPGKEITLFYPGQMSFELLLTQEEHSGAKDFRAGKSCKACHGGDEKASGSAMVRDKKAEPHPIPGKPGYIPVTVKAATQGGELYLRLEIAPGNQPNAAMDKDFPLKAAVMFGTPGVVEAVRAGCWGACHDDMTGMPSHQGATPTTKYLARSRVTMARNGGGAVKTANELAAIKAAGGILDLWQARVRGDGAVEGLSGHVLEDRRADGPKVAVTAESSGGITAITFSRALDAGPSGHVFANGQNYPMGISVHAGGTAGRFHYVSLEQTLSIGPGGDVSAAAR